MDATSIQTQTATILMVLQLIGAAAQSGDVDKASRFAAEVPAMLEELVSLTRDFADAVNQELHEGMARLRLSMGGTTDER